MSAPRRPATRALAAALAVVCLVTVAVTWHDRAQVIAAEEAALTAAASDARDLAAETRRSASAAEDLMEVRVAGAADGEVGARARAVVDEVRVLRARLEDARRAVADSERLSEGQQARLVELRGCVETLDRVRALLAGGDGAAATVALEGGRIACARAEELADGIVTAVHPFDFPDPHVVEVGGTFYAFGTNGPGGAVQVLSSTDLRDWAVRGSALPQVAGWARPGQTWAPAVLPMWDGFLLYYTVRHREWGHQCLSVARSDSPTGPYVDSSWAPITCQTDAGGSIDPSPYVGDDGHPYLTWKGEGETVGGQAVIWAARLDRHGTGIVGASVPLISTDRSWEGRVVEAPTMQRIDGTWVLLYSGGDWRTSGYATGHARCAGPLGPCTKPADDLVLQTTDAVAGPGGPSVFRTPGGRTMVAYAAWDPGRVGPPEPRRLHIAQLHLTPTSLTAS